MDRSKHWITATFETEDAHDTWGQIADLDVEMYVVRFGRESHTLVVQISGPDVVEAASRLDVDLDRPGEVA